VTFGRTVIIPDQHSSGLLSTNRLMLISALNWGTSLSARASRRGIDGEDWASSKDTPWGRSKGLGPPNMLAFWLSVLQIFDAQ
jgi:hypothetical protein